MQLLVKDIVASRFHPKYAVDDSTGCWVWTRAKCGNGYGVFAVLAKNALAHRVSWVIAFGEIPDGMMVLHRCDNPPCVNPAHLFLGTQTENMRDCKAKGRSGHGVVHLFGDRNGARIHKDRIPRGDRHYRRLRPETILHGDRIAKKLTAEKVLAIKTRLAEGARQTALAREYGVCSAMISNIANGKAWARVGNG